MAATKNPAATVTTTARGTCPADYVPLDSKPGQSRGGSLIPTGPDAALLCTYDSAAATPALKLTRSAPLSADRMAPVVSHLNSLPEWRAASDEANGCLMGGGSAHQILLTYPARPPVTVVVDCGVAVNEGAVRRLVNSKDLLNYWPQE